MKISIDASSGFCFGVVSAIERAEKILSYAGTTLYCLGDIVHNSEEVSRLKKIGLKVIDHEQYKKMRDITVLIRAHGEPPSTYKIAKENNITLIDATCPIVLSLQKRIKTGYEKMLSQNGQVIIYGKDGHAEVVALNGQTGNNAIVISSLAELEKMKKTLKTQRLRRTSAETRERTEVRDRVSSEVQRRDLRNLEFNRPTMLFSQTTMNSDNYRAIAEAIEAGCNNENGTLEVVDSICRSMSTRAEKIAEFARNNDSIIFVSDKKSSNGQYLYGVCKENNKNTFFVTSSKEINREDFLKYNSIGICGATSTPRWLMEEVAQKLCI